MSWRDQLRKASFRGVEFLVDSAEGQIGRRTVLHEYPLREKPYVEDLGRRARQFTIEAYVLATAATGGDYMPQRDRLVAAIEQAGPGQLVHPYLGEMRISITDAKLRESTAEGGMARFTLTCIEAGEVVFPQAVAGTQSLVSQKADAAAAQSNKEFAKKFSVKALPDFVAGSAKKLFGDAVSQLQDVTKLVGVVPSSLAELSPKLSSARSQLDSLVRDPAGLASTYSGLVAGIRGLTNSPADALKMLRKLFDFGKAGTKYAAAPTFNTTPARQAEAGNQAAALPSTTPSPCAPK